MRGSSELRDMIRKHGERETLLVLLEGKADHEAAEALRQAASTGLLLLALGMKYSSSLERSVVTMSELQCLNPDSEAKAFSARWWTEPVPPSE